MKQGIQWILYLDHPQSQTKGFAPYEFKMERVHSVEFFTTIFFQNVTYQLLSLFLHIKGPPESPRHVSAKLSL